MATERIRTDLACERCAAAGGNYTETKAGLCRLHTWKIATQADARASGCKKGVYQTLFLPPVMMLGEREREEITKQVAERLREMAAALLHTDDMHGKRILFVGLGNRSLTADALGPLTAERVHATAHWQQSRPALFAQLGCAALAVLAPGTAACSGIRSTTLTKAVAAAFQPDMILAVDALAARAFSRLASTIQFTDAGIAPGTGLHGEAGHFSRAVMGCPVLAVGVPMVSDTTALVSDTFASAGLKPPRAWRKKAAITERCFICPPEADALVRLFAEMIGTAVNRVFGVPEL